MKLREESIGKKAYSPLLGKTIKVSEENKELLMMSGLTQFFITDIELKPLKTSIPAATSTNNISQSKDLAYLLDIVSVQALKGFEGRKAKEVKKDLDLLSIIYPKGATLEQLAEIVKTHELPVSPSE
jgi:hypothetical protein